MRLDCKCSSDALRFIEVQCFELTVKWWRLHGMRRMYALALHFQLISVPQWEPVNQVAAKLV